MTTSKIHFDAETTEYLQRLVYTYKMAMDIQQRNYAIDPNGNCVPRPDSEDAISLFNIILQAIDADFDFVLNELLRQAQEQRPLEPANVDPNVVRVAVTICKGITLSGEIQDAVGLSDQEFDRCIDVLDRLGVVSFPYDEFIDFRLELPGDYKRSA